MRRIGIDVGGSTLRVGEVDVATGALVGAVDAIPMPTGARPHDVLQALAASPVLRAGEGPIGLAFPSVAQHGVARTAANVDRSWIDLDVADAFTRLTGRPTVFINDADAAGLAEVRFGAGRALAAEAAAGGPPVSRIIVLTFGTGIGTALFLDGRLWPNTELGHLMLPGVTDTDAEGWAAASVRTRLALDWSAWTRRVNDYLRELHRLLWPDVFIVGGAVSEHAAEWVPMLESAARIVPAALRGHAGVVGAALAAGDGDASAATAGAGGAA
ncbi:MAG: polyphosphate--glucose phosphotransferase [Gammaproteobacteria bacterium]